MQLNFSLCLTWVLIITCQALAAPQAADAGPQSTSVLPPAPQSPSLPPLIAALTALAPREAPLSLSYTSNGNIAAARSKAAGGSSALPGRPTAASAAAAAPLDALRPAAAAALARQHTEGTAPLSDDDIVAINILLSREGSPTSPYCYDTGLPLTGSSSVSAVPHLMTFGAHTPGASSSNSSSNSSMESKERLSRLRPLGPLSWLVRSYAVSGETLLKLRLTQQLQLIVQDAISDSLADSANLPPSQVVTFASSNLTLALGFTGVDWNDAAAAAGVPHKGLLAVQKAVQELSGNYDPGHTVVSFEPPAQARGSPAGVTGRSASVTRRPADMGGKQQATAAVVGSVPNSAAPVALVSTLPPAAANLARKLLNGQSQPTAIPSITHSSSSSTQRYPMAAGGQPGTPQPQVVYVRLYGMDPMNLTTLVDKLAGCSPQQAVQEAGSATAAAAAAGAAGAAGAGPTAGRIPEMKAGQAFKPSCAEVFRQQLQQQGVNVLPGPAFQVAPRDKVQASIGLSVAVGVTRDQQMSTEADIKVSAWLNSTAVQSIFGTFNLTVTSSDADYVSYVREKDSGQFPILPGFNLRDVLPSLFQQAIAAANKNISEQLEEQQEKQAGLVPGASTALNKGIVAGIIVAVVASVLALVGVVVLLLLRKRSDSSGGKGQQPDDAESAATRRRKRRPRMYHNKYLPDGGPVLGPNPAPDTPTRTSAAGAAAAAAAAAEGLRHTLQRGDSVMSQVDLELEESSDAHGDGDQGTESAGSSAAVMPDSTQQQQQQQRGLHKMVVHKRLERQEGEAGSSGSTSSSQQLLRSMLPSCSDAASSLAITPAGSCVWDDSGSVTAHTASVALTADSSSLSPWTSHNELQGSGNAAGVHGKQGSRTAGGKHRLATVGQTAHADADAADAAHAAGSNTSSGQVPEQREHLGQMPAGRGGAGGKQVQHLQMQMGDRAGGAAGGSFSMASAFAAMDAQLAAAVRAGTGDSSAGGAAKPSSSGGGSSASAKAVQPLGASCWHKGGHVSGFLVPEAAAAAGGGDAGAQQQVPGQHRSGGGMVSPFAAAIQLAHSVASDDV